MRRGLSSAKLTAGFLALTILAGLVWSGSFLLHLKSEYALEQFYPADHALLKEHARIRDQFRLNQKSPYLYVIELEGADPWLNPDQVQRLRELSQLLSRRADVNTVMSMTQVQGASQGEDELVIGNLFDRMPQQDWKAQALRNPLIHPLYVTDDFRATLLAIEPFAQTHEGLKRLETEAHAAVRAAFPQARIIRAGVPLMQTRLSGLIHSELRLFLVLISCAFCALFYFLFSHWSAIACAFICLLSSNVFAMALMSASGVRMNAILVTMPVIISVAVMSLLIHTLHLWSGQKDTKAGFDANWKRGLGTLAELGLPNALGILTTALGFLALTPSPIPLISQYGLTVALNLGFVAILNQLLMALLLPLVTPRMRPWFDRPARWALLGTRHPRKILLAVLLSTVGGVMLLSRLNFSARLFDDLPEDDATFTSSQKVDRTFGGIVPFEISARAPAPGFWKSPEALSQMDALTRRLRATPQVGTVVAVSDFFQGHIPADRGDIAETLFLFSLAERNPLGTFLTDDAQTTRLGVRLSDLPEKELAQVKARILQLCREAFPTVTFSQGGLATFAHAINQEVAHSLILDFWQPLFTIGIFLVLMFRSPRWALLSCLPNFVPPAFLIGALAFTGAPVKPSVALIFSISLGFAFNNTMYILGRLRLQMARGVASPLREALLMEANPCFFESFVMLVGFSFFLFSSFNMNRYFGGFMLISIIAGFVADLFFLPAFLQVFPRAYRSGATGLRQSRKLSGGIAATLVLSVLLGTSARAAGPDASEVLRKSRAQLDAKDDQASITMKIIEANGEVKERRLEIKTVRENGFSVLARIESPADIKGMAFLGKIDPKGEETQWIYLPSSGKVRRLVTGKSKAGLLGSEVSPEDLSSRAVKEATVKLLKSDATSNWIELTPRPGTSDYTRAVTKISLTDGLPSETLYYDGDKLTKTITFSDYTKIGAVWRAQLMTVKNHVNNRGTEVRFSQLKVNTGARASDFTEAALKDE